MGRLRRWSARPSSKKLCNCGVAAALDRVRDRWTLLILRERSFREQRFTDLRAGHQAVALQAAQPLGVLT